MSNMWVKHLVGIRGYLQDIKWMIDLQWSRLLNRMTGLSHKVRRIRLDIYNLPLWWCFVISLTYWHAYKSWWPFPDGVTLEGSIKCWQHTDVQKGWKMRIGPWHKRVFSHHPTTQWAPASIRRSQSTFQDIHRCRYLNFRMEFFMLIHHVMKWMIRRTTQNWLS